MFFILGFLYDKNRQNECTLGLSRAHEDASITGVPTGLAKLAGDLYTVTNVYNADDITSNVNLPWPIANNSVSISMGVARQEQKGTLKIELTEQVKRYQPQHKFQISFTLEGCILNELFNGSLINDGNFNWTYPATGEYYKLGLEFAESSVSVFIEGNLQGAFGFLDDFNLKYLNMRKKLVSVTNVSVIYRS